MSDVKDESRNFSSFQNFESPPLGAVQQNFIPELNAPVQHPNGGGKPNLVNCNFLMYETEEIFLITVHTVVKKCFHRNSK